MMLDFYDAELIDTINGIQEKIEAEEDKKNDIEMNIKIFSDYLIKRIREIRTVIPPDVLHLVWSNQNKDEKDDKFKDYYKYVNNLIAEDIIGDVKCKFKKTKVLDSIVVDGYGSYAYTLYFIVNDIKFSLTIPNTKNIRLEEIAYAHYGQYRLGYYSSEYCDSFIAQSYDFKDLKVAFKNFIENKGM